jgi:hypothetical protein
MFNKVKKFFTENKKGIVIFIGGAFCLCSGILLEKYILGDSSEKIDLGDGKLRDKDWDTIYKISGMESKKHCLVLDYDGFMETFLGQEGLYYHKIYDRKLGGFREVDEDKLEEIEHQMKQDEENNKD